MTSRDWRTPAVLILVALPCLIPFNFMPGVRVGGVPLGWLVFFPAGTFLLATSIWRIRENRTVPGFFVWSFALTLSLFASCWVAEARGLALSTSAGFAVRSLAIGWAAFLVGNDRRSCERFESWAPWVGVAAAMAALFEVATSRFFLIPRRLPAGIAVGELWSPDIHVAAGPIGQPLPLSAVLNLFLPFAVHRWIRRRDAPSALAAVVMMTGIILTYRRSAYIVMAISTLCVIVFENRRLLRPALAGAGIVALLAFSIPGVRHRIADRFDPFSTGYELLHGHRSRVYGTTWAMLKERPILGIGTRQYEKSYLRYARYAGAINTQDNQYLRMAAENGLVGIGVLLGFMGYLLRTLKRSRWPDARPFYVSCAGFAVTLLVLDGFYWPAPAMAFFAIAGAGCGAAAVSRD